MKKAVHFCSAEEFAKCREMMIRNMTDAVVEYIDECGACEEELEESRNSLTELLTKWWDDRNECGEASL